MYDQLDVQMTWMKGTAIEGFDSNMWRFDSDGRLMKKSDYGRKSEFGWEVFCVPGSYTGGISLLNLFPMNWRAN